MKAFKLKFALIILAVWSIPSASLAAVVVTDGTFGSQWISAHVTTGVGAGSGTQQGTTNMTTGGNPGAYRASTQTHGGRQNGTMTSRFFSLDTSFVFDPSLGPLNELSFSFDGIVFAVTNNSPVRFGAALRQNGRLFHHDPGASGAGTFSWQSFAFNLLSATDFVSSEPAFPSAAVDFSSTGAPIEFGYYSLATANFTTHADTGVDNWRLVVNPQSAALPVPEPSGLAAWLALVPLAATRLAIRRREKKTRAVSDLMES